MRLICTGKHWDLHGLGICTGKHWDVNGIRAIGFVVFRSEAVILSQPEA